MLAALRRARDLGFLGPGDVRSHLAHAAVFVRVCEPPAQALDLGSGGGIPGLALALAWPESTWVLLDANERRTAFLVTAVADLGLADRVGVRRARAEVAGRDPDGRGAFDVVVARGFGPPPVTAECGSPFLRVGGRLVVSEPPTEDPTRWDPAGLAELGLRIGPRADEPQARVQVLEQGSPCPVRFPRRTGIPAKRPLW
ncbi:MAG: 16S rRNA (guanine(527)-N(7))-methyltransferase RsmG [Acidimicrobiales bacterium]